jgi:methylated-DNA-protein-cysteine methyltransferase related protein
MLQDWVSDIRAVIRRIPKGKVSTYGAVAEAAGYPRGARLAVKALQGAIGLPWHRVVASGGRIALRGEAAFEQRFRLESEGVRFRGKRVDVGEFEHRFSGRKKMRLGCWKRPHRADGDLKLLVERYGQT